MGNCFVLFYVSTIKFHIVKVVGGHTQKVASQCSPWVRKTHLAKGIMALVVTTPPKSSLRGGLIVHSKGVILRKQTRNKCFKTNFIVTFS